MKCGKNLSLFKNEMIRLHLLLFNINYSRSLLFISSLFIPLLLFCSGLNISCKSVRLHFIIVHRLLDNADDDQMQNKYKLATQTERKSKKSIRNQYKMLKQMQFCMEYVVFYLNCWNTLQVTCNFVCIPHFCIWLCSLLMEWHTERES